MSTPYLGLLAPLWGNLSASLPENGLLNGQQLTVSPQSGSAYLAIDSEDRAHFLLYPAPSNANRLSKFNLSGLTFEVKTWVVSNNAAQKYLDIVCSAGVRSAMRRPFSKFCEDILVELESGKYSPEESVYRTCVRWQRFWAQDEEEEISPEWERGLLGELSILELLISRYASSSGAVAAWTGPDSTDQDFQAFDMAVEVKTTVVMPPRMMVSNLRQLDPSLFKHLLISLFVVTPSDQGTSLFDKVQNIESHLNKDPDTLDVFWKKLSRAGYRRHLEGLYASHKYTLSEPKWLEVDEKFPKITANSFCRPLDGKISKVQYVVELSDLRTVELEGNVSDCLKRLCGG